jgi:cysteine desulfurase
MTPGIYLDYMATTPIDPIVVETMLPYLKEMRWCANAGSINHAMGQEVLKLIDTKRTELAEMVGANPEEILWTSGATESNNLALLGAARFYQRQGKHLITVQTEHKAVLNVFEALEKEGFEVTYLPTSSDGLLDLEILEKTIRADTILVSVMQVNNEIGVIQNIDEIAQLLAQRGIIFHVDAAQGFGPLGINLSKTPVSLMSFSAHKVYGPKGVGALYVRRRPRVQLQAIIFGGGQEHGLRPGTLATHQIVGMTKAFELCEARRAEDQKYFFKLRDIFLQGIQKLPNWHINGSMKQRIAGNLNICIEGVDGSELVSGLYPLMVSSQSACSAALGNTSHVLRAIGLSESQARASVRISFGRMTQIQEIPTISEIFCQAIEKIRR